MMAQLTDERFGKLRIQSHVVRVIVLKITNTCRLGLAFCEEQM
jgi:hypothetical protein